MSTNLFPPVALPPTCMPNEGFRGRCPISLILSSVPTAIGKILDPARRRSRISVCRKIGDHQGSPNLDCALEQRSRAICSLRVRGIMKPNCEGWEPGNQHQVLGSAISEALGNLYYHAVACILPSITYETFGMIIIEAFARMTPVIVRDLGAFPEVIHDSGGGFIYRTDEELLTAMNRTPHRLCYARRLAREVTEPS